MIGAARARRLGEFSPAGEGQHRGPHPREAYGEACHRERDVILPDGTTHAGRTPAHWRRVALLVARMMGKQVSIDAARRMLGRSNK